MVAKLHELLEAVTAKTTAGKLSWRAFGDESFRVPIGNDYLHIYRSNTRIEEDERSYPAVVYSMQVCDEQGRVVTEAEATQGFQSEPSFQILAELFEAARRSALHPDGVVDRMLGVLRSSA